MVEQRLVVTHEEVVELKIQIRHVEREPEDVGGNFGGCHD
jgi:hypothetical protein